MIKFIKQEDLSKNTGISELLDSVILGDCLYVLKKIPSETVDMVFFDPPYFLQLPRSKRLIRWYVKTVVDSPEEYWDLFDSWDEYDVFIARVLREIRRVMRRNATIWAIGTYHNIFRIGKIMQDLGFWILNDVIWFKINSMPNWLNVRFSNSTETLIWAVKDRGVKNYVYNHKIARSYSFEDFGSRIALNIWRIPIVRGRERLRDESGKKLHPTQKPEELLRRVIEVSTNEGDIVLDPMAGTGTTGVVAKRMNRRFIMIEKEKRYVDAILRRFGLETYSSNNLSKTSNNIDKSS